MKRSWQFSVRRIDIGVCPELTPEEMAAAAQEEERLRLESIIYDADTARSMMLSVEPARKLLHEFTRRVQASPGRPVEIQTVIDSERMGVFADAKAEFLRAPSMYKKLLHAIFPDKLRDSAPVNPITKAPEEKKGSEGKKYVDISRSEARTASVYQARKLEAEREGAQLRIREA